MRYSSTHWRLVDACTGFGPAGLDAARATVMGPRAAATIVKHVTSNRVEVALTL